MNCDFCFRSGNFSKKIYIFTLQILYISSPNGRNIIFNKFSSRLCTISCSLLCFRHFSFKLAKRWEEKWKEKYERKKAERTSEIYVKTLKSPLRNIFNAFKREGKGEQEKEAKNHLVIYISRFRNNFYLKSFLAFQLFNLPLLAQLNSNCSFRNIFLGKR